MSDLLIRGMEMPTNQVLAVINPDGLVEILNNDNTLIEEHEVVHIQPHGRLGDLDALAKQVEHERFHHAHTDGLAARHHVAEYGHFLKAIVDTPTIIQASEELT